MLSFGVAVFVAFSCSKVASGKEEGLDVIIQRYKALGYSEISGIKNQRYKFRFCACDDDSTSPESDSRCACSRGEDAELVQKSVPHALYSSSCIHSPKQGKCLVGSIITSPKQKDLYMKLSIDGATLTDPPYQKIPLSRFRSNARLTCAKEPCSRSCLPCKSGFLEISYVVISKTGSSRAKEVSEMADFRKLRESSTLLQPLPEIRKFDSSQIKAFSELFPDWSQEKISSFATMAYKLQMDKIKAYLLAKSAQIAVAPSTFDAKSYRQSLLKYHNVYRSRHGAPPLTNNDQLQDSAQQWAQQLANSASCLKHDPFKRYGESLFFYAAREFPDEATLAEATVQSFYIEAPGYNYTSFKPFDYYKTGHFTQLIWKSTKTLGIGVAIRRFDGHHTNDCQPNFDSSLLYVVVKYDPPGNIQSPQYYLENVSPARY